ncbi:MAG: hypothetical protein ACJ72W_24540 [Actinoallomurus sp.]
MTGGGSAAPEPLDLSEISRSGDLFDALAARRVDPGSGSVISDDPAARLLAALVVDVDVDAPPLPVPARVSYGGPKKPGRPVVRAFVAFGAVTVMLTTAGAAVAGGGGGGEPKADSPSARLEVSERARPGLESIVRALSGAPRPTADRTTGEARPSPSPSATKTSGVPTAPAKKGRTPGFPGLPHSRPFGPRRGPSATPSPTPSPTAPTDSPAPISAPPSATPQPQDQTSGDPSHRSRRQANPGGPERTAGRDGR